MHEVAVDTLTPRAGRPWKRAAAWLALLGPLFYLSYGFANAMAARRDDVPSIVFGWEHAIPFWAWTILPYWTTNLFYAGSLFLCRDRVEVDTLARRLLTVQLLAVTCFLLWPLTFSFSRPDTHGLFGAMFDALTGFDKPFNQAPSLHIALTVILWVHYLKFLRGAARWLLHGWFALVCVSVLTTYQHHFIDMPTGAAAGWLCVWLWPERIASPLRRAQLALDPRRWLLAGCYALAATICFAAALHCGGWALWLCWPALSLMLVAMHYAWLGAGGFQKREDGRLSMASRWLHAPYLLVAWINSRAWTWRAPQPQAVVDGVWLGRIPSRAQRGRHALHEHAVVDVCAELSLPGGAQPGDRVVPMLDLVTPDITSLRAAADAIEAARSQGHEVLVCCALGFSRSACAVAAWLLATGRACNVDDAVTLLSSKAPRIVLRDRHRLALAGFAATCSHADSDAGSNVAESNFDLRAMARLLWQGRKLNAVSLLLAAVAALALLIPILPGLDAGLAVSAKLLLAGSLLCGLLQLFFAIRVGFDAELFEVLAETAPRAAADPIAADRVAADRLDAALQSLGLQPAGKAGRDWPARMRGAMGLLRSQVLALLAQVILLLAAAAVA